VSVRRHDNGTILLEGDCPVEDAEPLLRLLQADPAAPLDWSACGYLHTAVMQVIVAARPVHVGDCGDSWVRQWLASNPLAKPE
jgi:hypothetical protein